MELINNFKFLGVSVCVVSFLNMVLKGGWSGWVLFVRVIYFRVRSWWGIFVLYIICWFFFVYRIFFSSLVM